MDIFSVFSFAGGLGLFLFGMNVLGEAIGRQAGGRMKSVLGRIASNRVVGLTLGAGVTAVIQSSGATTVMILGFVNSGLMSLADSVAPIFGANIGTTATAWLLALTDISGESVLLRLLNPDSFVPVLAFIGAVLLVFCKTDRRRDAGMMLLGFAVLMFGMGAMSDAMAPLRDSELFRELLTVLDNPLLGILAGFAVAAILQSSSAAVGIVQAAAVTGAVTIANALPIIMGVNIGAGIIVMVAAMGKNRDAHRAAWVYMIHNVVTMLLWLAALLIVEAAGGADWLYAPVHAFNIALLHTCYKAAGAAVQLPFVDQLLWLTGRIIRPTAEEQTFALLDEDFLKTPPLAVSRCSELTNEMAELTLREFRLAAGAVRSYDAAAAREVREMEDRIDMYEDKIGNYISKLSASRLNQRDSREVTKLMYGISDFERISDHARNIMESGEELDQKDIALTEEAAAELEVLFRAVEDSLALAAEAFIREDRETARRAETMEQVVDDLRNALRDRHIERQKQGEYSTTMGFVLTDLLTDLERISDHCSNIAVSVLEMRHSEYEPHRYEARLKANNADYARLYKEFSEKYRV